jgi:hypothetical protein
MRTFHQLTLSPNLASSEMIAPNQQGTVQTIMVPLKQQGSATHSSGVTVRVGLERPPATFGCARGATTVGLSSLQPSVEAPSLYTCPAPPAAFAPLIEAPGAVYIPPSPGSTIIAKKFRTKMCKNFAQKGSCPFDSRCMFAHGKSALRSAEQNFAEGLTSETAIKEFQRRESESQSAIEDSEEFSKPRSTPPTDPTDEATFRGCTQAGSIVDTQSVLFDSSRSDCRSPDHELVSIRSPPIICVPEPLTFPRKNSSQLSQTTSTLWLGGIERSNKNSATQRTTKRYQHSPYSWTFLVQQQCDR